MIERIKPWWQSLALRERHLLTVGGGLLVVMILWYGLWSPLQQQIKNSELQVERQRQTLHWMQSKSSELRNLQATSATGVGAVLNGSVEATLYQSARQFQLSIQRIQPQGKQFSVDIANASFNQLLDWFLLLEQQYGISVTGIELTAEPSRQGVVQVRRLLLRGSDND